MVGCPQGVPGEPGKPGLYSWYIVINKAINWLGFGLIPFREGWMLFPLKLRKPPPVFMPREFYDFT